MKKHKVFLKSVLCIIALIVLFCPPAPAFSDETAEYSDTEYMFEELADITGASSLESSIPSATRELMEELGISSLDFKTILSLTPSDAARLLWGVITDFFTKPLKSACILVAIVLLCALLDAVRESVNSGESAEMFKTVCILCACAVVLAPAADCIERASESIRSSADFMISFAPVFSTVITASGKPVSAAAYYALIFAAAQIVSQIAAKTLVPLLGVYLAFSIASSITPFNLDSVRGSVKSFVNWTLGVSVTIFVSLLSLQSFVASGADTVAMRTAKLILGSAIPIVGGAVSEALSTTQACVGLLKTSAGVYAVIAVCLTVLPVIAESVLWILSLKLSQTAADVMGISPISRLLGAVQDALSVLLACLVSFMVLIVVTTAIMMLLGVSV